MAVCTERGTAEEEITTSEGSEAVAPQKRSYAGVLYLSHCCNVLVTGALPRSFDNRQRVSGSSGHLRLAAAARLSLSPLTFSCSCFGANFRRLRTELSLKVRVNKGVHNLRPAQSEQAIPAAGGHITGFPGKYRCVASSAASHSDWLKH